MTTPAIADRFERERLKGLAARNVTPEAMLRHIRVITRDHTVQLWFGNTHIVNAEPESVIAIVLQSFAADRDALSAIARLDKEDAP